MTQSKTGILFFRLLLYFPDCNTHSLIVRDICHQRHLSPETSVTRCTATLLLCPARYPILDYCGGRCPLQENAYDVRGSLHAPINIHCCHQHIQALAQKLLLFIPFQQQESAVCRTPLCWIQASPQPHLAPAAHQKRLHRFRCRLNHNFKSSKSALLAI
jgi:hypothetical protein